MKKTHKTKKNISSEGIAKLAEQGKNISGHFTNKGKMMAPIQRVNVDFTQDMLNELDKTAEALNISRQAVIKTLIRQSLDQHYLAQKAKKAG
jgi:DNA invertase Pin-like site-specific DNA recombinase